MAPLTVAACQLAGDKDPRTNLEAIRGLARRAADAGARLAVFPEASMARFGSPIRTLAQPLDGEFADGVRALAEETQMLLVVGMFTPADGGRVHNTALATGAGVEAAYHKIHLYDAFGARESDTIAPGSDLVVLEALGTRIGLSICYDVRFADQFTALGRRGAQVVCLPTSWGDGPGKAEQWDLLVRARAMDAQAFLVAADMAWAPPEGSEPLGIGRSAVVSPLGLVAGRLDHRPGVLVSTLELDDVADVRGRVPIL